MSNEKPLALRLADAMRDGEYLLYESRNETEAELRRLHAESEENARVIGAGSEREARMMAQVEELRREVERLKAQPAEPVTSSDEREGLAYGVDGTPSETSVLRRFWQGLPIPDYMLPAWAKTAPAARVAEVHMSRYTVEWENGPLPEGTKLYTAPPAAARVPLTLDAVRALPTVKAPEIDGEESDGTPRYWCSRPYVSLTQLERLLSAHGIEAASQEGAT